MHPGNAFVTADGRIAPVDFGIMGRLDERAREDLADLLAALLNGDYHRLASLMIAVGWVPAEHEPAVLAQACRAVAALRQPLAAMSVGALFGQILSLARRFDMRPQPELLLLQKTMVAEGVGRRLDPSINIWAEARPLISAWMIEHRGPAARVAKTAAALTRLVDYLPRWVDRLERAARRLRPDRRHTARARPAPWPGRAWLWAAILLAGLALIAAAGLRKPSPSPGARLTPASSHTRERAPVTETYATAQERFWAGEFGTDYSARNQGADRHRRRCGVEVLRQAAPLTSLCEFGANIGLNLVALGQLQPAAVRRAIEFNPTAGRLAPLTASPSTPARWFSSAIPRRRSI